MILPFPYKRYQTACDITAGDLTRMGVSGLLLDIDGTLAPTHVPEPEPRFLRWGREMQEAGVALFILSNNRSGERARHYGELFGCDWLCRAKKPGPEGFTEAARRLGLPFSRLAVVGDQIYTDMLGARRLGMKGLLVQSTDDVWYRPFRRLAEQPFLYREVRK